MWFFGKPDPDNGFCKIRRAVLRDTRIRLARLRELYITSVVERATKEDRKVTYEEDLEMQRVADNVMELRSAEIGTHIRISDQEHAWERKNK